MPKVCKAVTVIDVVRPLSNSNYLMTCSESSVNIWSTKIGLYLSAGYNFKKQIQQVKESKNVCSLYWSEFAKVVDKDGVSIMVRKKLKPAYQEKPKPAEEEKKADTEPTEDQKKPEAESTEGEKKTESAPTEPVKKSANGSGEEAENDDVDLCGLFNEADSADDQIADPSSDEEEWPEESVLSSFENIWFNNPAKKEEEKKEEVKKTVE